MASGDLEITKKDLATAQHDLHTIQMDCMTVATDHEISTALIKTAEGLGGFGRALVENARRNRGVALIK